MVRRGKVLIADLDSDDHLVIRLMMTGQVVVDEAGRRLFAGGHPSQGLVRPVPDLTTRVSFKLDGGRTLFFNDGRKFGRVGLSSSAALATDPFLARLGPEPLTAAFTLDGFHRQLARHHRAPIKAVILNQSVVAGVGNIYADESLHLARVHPARGTGSLTAVEASRLHDAIIAILTDAITSGGTGVVAGANPGSQPVGYLKRARVFRREGQPCRVCETPIVRAQVAGRGTRFCPQCQPLRPARWQDP